VAEFRRAEPRQKVRFSFVERKAATGAGLILLTLCTGQFLMMLDSSVMNVSMATVADDLGTSITGIQTAITLYTLVMAAFMITGGKIGQIVGRSRAFAIGCVIYGAGSLVTALAPSLPVLLIGWSGLEGLGAALIMPSIVALVASNFAAPDRPRAYGLVTAAAAVAVAAGPIIGGLATTYLSWRYVFAGEVLVVAVILVLSRRIEDEEPGAKVRLDLAGTALSAAGLGLIVFGILRSGTWGIVRAKSGAPEWLGLSPAIWLILGGGMVIWLFALWENRVLGRGGEPLVDPAILRTRTLRAGLTSFFFQYLLQGGLFFAMPLFLSVALGLSAIDTGVRLLPLSATLILSAAGVPKLFPHASPRRVVRIGFLLLLAGLLVLIGGLQAGAGAGVTTWPMLLAGLGIGALASQLGSVTVSSVPDEQSGEVGGLQNTITNLGISIGTALTGAIVIATLSSAALTGIEANPQVPAAVKSQAATNLGGGVPFVSDRELEAALDKAEVTGPAAEAIVEENESARLVGLRSALAILAGLAIVALLLTGRIPDRQPTGAASAP
jgi:MFS family permease